MRTPFKKDLTGLIVHRLTVLEFAYKRGKRLYWKCICSCPNKTICYVRSDGLTGKKQQMSCGCLRDEIVSKNSFKHGHAIGINTPRSSEYHSWGDMIQRCNNPNVKKFYNHGGRGIKVCERWSNNKNGFQNFLSDMGLKPTSRHTIDRFPNKDGNYEPSNCRWATYKEQNRNTSQNVWFEYEGQKYLMDDLAIKFNMTRDKVSYHLQKCGRPVEYLLTLIDVEAAKIRRYRSNKNNIWYEYGGRRMIINDWIKELKANQSSFSSYVKKHGFEAAYQHYTNKLK